MTVSAKNNDGLKAKILIEPNDLLIGLEQVLEECSNSVFLGLSNLESLENDPQEFQAAEDNFHCFPIFGRKYNLTSKKQIFRNWLLKKGFEDLIKAATKTLVSAHVILDLRAELSKRNNLTTIEELRNLIKNPELSNKPTKRDLPHLLKGIKQSLSQPLTYEEEVKSINNIRRCLVHRNGHVTEVDTYGANELTLKWIAFQPIYINEETNETIKLTELRVLEGPGKFEIETINRSRSFRLGETFEVDFKEFNELLWTVHLFGKDFISKFSL